MKRVALALAVALASFAPGVSHATLVGQTVGVSLTDGGALSFSDSVLVVEPGAEITPGDGSAIGGVLLPTESVDVRAQSIVLSLEEGAADGTTGYPLGTSFVLTNLVFLGTPTRIVGISVSTVNITNLLGVSFTDDSLTIPIDALVIGDVAGVDVGTVTVALEIEVVPEPASLALLVVGLAGLGAFGRRPRATR